VNIFENIGKVLFPRKLSSSPEDTYKDVLTVRVATTLGEYVILVVEEYASAKCAVTCHLMDVLIFSVIISDKTEACLLAEMLKNLLIYSESKLVTIKSYLGDTINPDSFIKKRPRSLVFKPNTIVGEEYEF
jgi:hypothetical protein